MKQIQLLVTVQIPDTSPQRFEERIPSQVKEVLEEYCDQAERIYCNNDADELFEIVLNRVELCPNKVYYEKYEKHEGWCETTEQNFDDTISKINYDLSVLAVRKIMVLKEDWSK